MTIASPRKRRRRRPADAEREILDAAERALQTIDFRDLTVDEVMSRTGMQRSAFYNYFAEKNALILRLLERIESEMLAATNPWLEARDDGRAALGEALDGIVHIYARHGHVLRAIHEASYHDHEVEAEYRGRIIENFVDVVAKRLRAIGAPRSASAPGARDVAHALITMNVNVMAERLGRSPADRPSTVSKTLRLMWEQVVYALPPEGPRS